MGGYKNGKVEIFYGDSPPSNLNILWQKRIVTGDIESSELMQYNNNLNIWQSLANASKAPLSNPAFTGTPTINGELISTVPDNGTNYLMVYGTGTPTENAAELQAAYDEAKTMPRYCGDYVEGTTYYKGQTFNEAGSYYIALITSNDGIGIGLVDSVTEAEAKSVRTTVIVAPGVYTFGTANLYTNMFKADTFGIDIVSLTGNPDVIIDGINVTVADTTTTLTGIVSAYLKGFNGGIYPLAGSINGLKQLKFEKCIGGAGSFSGSSNGFDATAIDCVVDSGGDYNDQGFGGIGGSISGTLIRCTGDGTSFGGGDSNMGNITATARIENCKFRAGSGGDWSNFTPTIGGHIIFCINADGSVATNV